MRAILRTILALIYLASATLAQAGFVINSFQFGVGAASINFVGCASDTSGVQAFTFTDLAIGDAANRSGLIIGTAGNDNATNFNIVSMTVGGNAAAEQVDNSASTGSLVQSAIYTIADPGGTTATFVVTFSESIFYNSICVWAAYGLLSLTATDVASDFETSSAPMTLDLDVSAGGVAVGMGVVNDDTSTTWTGMTERADTVVAIIHSYSSADTNTAGTPLAVSADWVDTADSVGVSASFR